MEIGQRVRIKPEELDGFYAEVQRRCGKGRIGVITGMLLDMPIVTFPAEGRKKEYVLGRCPMRWLEIVEGE